MIMRRITVLGAALVLAVVGTVAVSSYVRKADARALAGQQDVRALVAVKTIPAGTTARDAESRGLLTTTTLPRRTVPAEALTSIASIRDQVALSDIVAGELLLPSRFGARLSDKPAISLPAGDVAVSVSLTDPEHVGGFVAPGADVAVFDTFNAYDGNQKPWTPAGNGIADRFEYNRATRVLLPRVQVLAVGAETTTTQVAPGDTSPTPAPQPSAAPTTGGTVLLTLAVNQREAAKLIQAAQTGHLYFALLDDHSETNAGSGVDNRTLFDGK